MTWGLILVASLISAVLYRLGGQGKPFNTRYRDIGCPLVAVILYIALKGFHLGFWWAYLAMFGLGWAAMATYWDFIFKKDNFWVHGFFAGLSALPLAWCGVNWWAIALRCLACAVFMGVWSLIWKWDIAEEAGRGFIFTASVGLLLI